VDESLWNGVFWNYMVYPELSSDDTDDPMLTVSGIHKESLGGRFFFFYSLYC
jgi:hypothetical protein